MLPSHNSIVASDTGHEEWRPLDRRSERGEVISRRGRYVTPHSDITLESKQRGGWGVGDGGLKGARRGLERDKGERGERDSTPIGCDVVPSPPNANRVSSI